MILWRKHETNDCFWDVCRYLVCTIKDKPTYLLMVCWWLLMFFWIWSLLTSVELLPSSFADAVTLAASQGFKSQIIQNNKSRRSSWLCMQELWSWHVLPVQSGHHQGSWTPLLFLQMLGSGNANGRPIAWDRSHRECVVKWSVVGSTEKHTSMAIVQAVVFPPIWMLYTCFCCRYCTIPSAGAVQAVLVALFL